MMTQQPLDRPQTTASRAMLVNMRLDNQTNEEAALILEEFKGLVQTANIEIVDIITGPLRTPSAHYFIGSGKVEAIQDRVGQYENIDCVIVNHLLTAVQERNLEQKLKIQVLDRMTLILAIFAQRARTFEGKLQVELAQLNHLSTRLIRGWTHLERQKGGIGLRGPGETQLETDRRLIRRRILSIEKRLEKVRSQRAQSRHARRRSDLSTLALVGYTNAGKSTLFNCLTHSHIDASNQHFATLDTTLRSLSLPIVGKVILADTVGFIRHLPHELIKAFRATLEEVNEATLLLHVVDASSPELPTLKASVEQVLEQIGATHQPCLQVYNKIDQLPTPIEPRIDRNAQGKPQCVWLSAKTGWGMELLEQALSEWLSEQRIECSFHLSAKAYGLRAALYRLTTHLTEQPDGCGGYYLHVYMTPAALAEFNRLYDQQNTAK